MRIRPAPQVYLALSFALISDALPSSLNSSVPQISSATNSSSLASSSAPQSSSIFTASTAVSSKRLSIPSGTSASSYGSSSAWLQSSTSSPRGSSLSFGASGLTTTFSASLSAASSADFTSSAASVQWSPPEVHAASNGSSNSSGFPRFRVDQKENNVPGITATALYLASGVANYAVPSSITSMRNPFNVTKPLNQTNVCGGPISIASSLITSGLFPANDCLPLNWDQGVLNMSYGGTCSMSPGFDGYNAKSCSCVNSAAKWYHDYATATITSQQCQSSYNMYEATDIQSLGCSYNTITELATPYPAPTSCCDKCEVAASAVQLVYWPPADAPSNSSSGTNNTGSTNWNVTAAPIQSAASYGIVENGFTFISPSVYVIYSSIQASASCVALFNSHIPIGSAYTAVTRAYEPNGLSSAICEAENMGAGIEYCISPVDDQDNPAYCFQGIDNGWRQINFSELYDPPPASDLLTRYQSCFPGHSISPDFASMMFVKPQFAFPPDVTDIDPVWATWGGSTCTPVNLGVYDPPRVLQKATALAPVPTPATDPQAEKAPPSPAATLRSPVAAPTKAVSTNDPNSGAKANDPGSNNAGTATPTTAQSDPANAVVDPVDPSVVAQNEGSPATGDNHVVEAGSNSNSDPVASGGSTTPPDTETQSGAKAATNSETNPGTGSGTGNSDPSTAPITLLPQQPADAAKENSGTSGTSGTSGDTGDTVGGTTGGTTGGTNAETSNDSNGGTSGGTTGTNGGTSGDTDSGSSGGTSDGASDSPIGDGNANSAPIALVNSQPITKDTSGNILLSGSTLAPGSTAVFSGHTIVNAPSAIIKDGSTYAPSTSAPSASPLLVNNQLLQMTNGRLKLGSQILEPGTHTTMNNHVIDYANPTQVVEDGVTHNLAPVSSSNPLVLSGQTLLQAPNGGLITAGTTIAPDSAAAIDGHLYSLAGSSSVIMDGKTYALPAATNAYQIQAVTSPPPTVPSGPLTLSNGLVITAQPSTSSDTPQNFLLPNGASLSAGGTAALYSGTTYSLLPSNAGILAAGPSGSFTLTLALPTTTPPPTATNSIFTAASMTFTPEPSGFTLGTTSLTPGGPALTTGGTVLSLGPSGTFVLASSTWLLPPQSIFSAAGATFTAEPTGFNIGTLTSLAPGDAAFSTDGTVVSLGTDSLLHLGSKTYSLVAAPPRSVFTLDNGETFTAAATGFEIAGTEVSPGGRGVLEGGVTVALGTGGVLEVGSLTVTLVGGTSTRGLGGAIVSGLNGGGGGSGGVFEGGAARWRGRERGGWGAGWLGVVVGVGVGVVAVVL